MPPRGSISASCRFSARFSRRSRGRARLGLRWHLQTSVHRARCNASAGPPTPDEYETRLPPTAPEASAWPFLNYAAASPRPTERRVRASRPPAGRQRRPLTRAGLCRHRGRGCATTSRLASGKDEQQNVVRMTRMAPTMATPVLLTIAAMTRTRAATSSVRPTRTRAICASTAGSRERGNPASWGPRLATLVPPAPTKATARRN